MSLEPSILKSTKQILGVGDADDSFDLDIMMHINGAFSALEQLGPGPVGGYRIEDDSGEWDDFDADIRSQSMIKTFVFLYVGLLFDPPTIGYLVTAKEKQLAELTWRISTRWEATGWTDPDPEVDSDE